jgi:hypothetical protein
MPVATTYDLSEITDALVAILTDAVSAASPIWSQNGGQVPFFTIAVTGSSPETRRAGATGDCQLTLYLMHVGQNPFIRNTPVLGNTALLNTQTPLGLDLSYLLTAYAADNAGQEQQAMSIALRAFHEQPLYLADGNELTITLGADKLDDMSRLWQSFTAAYRFSTIFRVAVALLRPTQAPPLASPPPTRIGLAVAPAPALALGLAAPGGAPILYGLANTTSYTPPPPPDTDPAHVAFATLPLAITAGETIRVSGQGLDAVTVVTLATLDGATTWPVTGWRTGTPSATLLALALPAQYAVGDAPPVPGSTPTPGVYLLSVGTAAPPFTSPAIPLVVVPSLAAPGDPPLLAPAGGIYTIDGAGFVPGATQIYLGGQQLTSPEVTVGPQGTTISFALPASLPSGLQPVRIRVDGIDAPPAWQLVAP